MNSIAIWCAQVFLGAGLDMSGNDQLGQCPSFEAGLQTLMAQESPDPAQVQAAIAVPCLQSFS